MSYQQFLRARNIHAAGSQQIAGFFSLSGQHFLRSAGCWISHGMKNRLSQASCPRFVEASCPGQFH
eukprot:1155457-Pelagomonas_calceolata.AAC.1